MGNGNNFICLTLTQLLNASHTSQTHRGLKPTQPRRCWDCREGEAAFCSMCAPEFITQRSSLHHCWRADSAGSKERIKKKKSGSSWNNVKKKKEKSIQSPPQDCTLWLHFLLSPRCDLQALGEQVCYSTGGRGGGCMQNNRDHKAQLPTASHFPAGHKVVRRRTLWRRSWGILGLFLSHTNLCLFLL